MNKTIDVEMSLLVNDVLLAFREHYCRTRLAEAMAVAPTEREAAEPRVRKIPMPLPTLVGDAARRETALREWRNREARERNVSPFVVMSNRTAHTIALRDPRVLEELRGLYGVGAKLLERYGEKILSELARLRDSAPAPDLRADSTRTESNGGTDSPSLAG